MKLLLSVLILSIAQKSFCAVIGGNNAVTACSSESPPSFISGTIESIVEHVQPQPIPFLPITDDYLTSLESRININDMLQQLINQAVHVAVDTAHNLQQRILALFEGFYNALMGVQSNAGKIIEDLHTNISRTLAQYRDVGTCIQDHVIDVQKVINGARSTIHGCVRQATNEVQTLSVDLQQYTDAIADDISIIQDLLKKCSASVRNPLDIAQCVIANIKELGESISEVVADGVQGLKVAGLAIYSISNDSRLCVTSAVEKARLDAGEVLTVIQKCIQNSTKEEEDINV